MVSGEELVLEEQLSFILYACAKETIKRYQPYLKELDLTYTQYITMLVLWNDSSITVNDLGKRLYLDSGTMTPILKKLEGKGYIKRDRKKEDERIVLISVTEKGYELQDKVRRIPNEIINQTGVPKSEAEEILQKLKGILERVNSL